LHLSNGLTTFNPANFTIRLVQCGIVDTMNDHSVRRYNEKETRWLLERAGELQRSLAGSSRHDLTLQQLESIALEAGLDPAQLRQAARELDAGGRAASTRILGAPLQLVFERTLPFDVDEKSFANLLSAIEAAAGDSGRVTQIGQPYTWESSRANAGRVMQVRFSSGGGATKIRVEERLAHLAGGLFGGVLGGVGGGLGIGAGTSIALALNSVALAFALPAAVIGTTFVSLRAGFKRYVRRRSAILQQLLDDIERALPSAANEQLEGKTPEQNPR
jgi:hypothetical protein